MKTIRNLILTGLFFFTVSFDSCTTGVDYDRKYKISPEIDFDSCIISPVYGKRWQRLGSFSFFIGSTLFIAAYISYNRSQEVFINSLRLDL